MKSWYSTLLVVVLNLSLLVCAEPLADKRSGKGTVAGPGAIPAIPSVLGVLGSGTTTVTTSILSLRTTTIPNTPAPSVVTETTGFLTVTSVAASVAATSSIQQASGSSSLTITVAPMPSGPANTTDQSFVSTHKTLVIVLCSVLGTVGLLLSSIGAFLPYQYRKRQYPFGHRGASPIDDDEIASWRINTADQKLATPLPEHTATIREVSQHHMHSPGRSGTASPTSIHTLSDHMESPSFLARAPNAREGLTDEVVPGAQAYIPAPRRQSSRLSKPPPGSRSKSRRSSVSTKSMWSVSHHRNSSSDDSKRPERSTEWYDMELESGSRHMTLRSDNGASSPENSTFDGLSNLGGLSPRPRSPPRIWDDKEIGRAIA